MRSSFQNVVRWAMAIREVPIGSYGLYRSFPNPDAAGGFGRAGQVRVGVADPGAFRWHDQEVLRWGADRAARGRPKPASSWFRAAI